MYTHSIIIDRSGELYGEWETEADFHASLPPLRTWIENAPPTVIENWRVKAVLDLQGLTAAVESAIAAIPDGPDKIVITRAWQGNGSVARNSPTVAALSEALGLTDQQLDDMFALAATFAP